MSQQPLSPFRLRYIQSISAQRKRFFSSRELAPVKPHPTLERLVSNLPQTILEGSSELRSQVFWPAIKPGLPILAEILFLHCISAVCVLLGVWIGSRYLDKSTLLGGAMLVCSLVVVLEFIRERVFYHQLFLQGNLARVTQLSLFSRVNKKLHTIDPDAGDDFSKGNLKVLIGSDIDNIEDFINAMAWIWFPALTMLFVLSPFVLSNLGRIGAAGISTCFLQIVVAAVLGVLLEKLQSKKQLQEDALTTRIGEWVRNIRLARFLGMQQHLRQEVKHAVRTMTLWGLLKHVVNCLSFAFSSSLWLLVVLVMLTTATYFHIPIELTTFFPSLWALTYIASYFEHVPYTLMLFGPALAGAKRVKKLLLATELEDAVVPYAGTEVVGNPVSIIFRDVSLKINETELLKNINLSLRLDQRTALIGTVGAGKSLLLSLITGERAHTSGSIDVEFENGNIAPFWRADVYKKIRSICAVSEQSPFLSSATLRENVDLTDSHTMAEIQRAVIEAEMESDISILPSGLDEEVGEVGVNLSGGQKQRVSLARAFITDRKYFVLDDPLSAVDAVTEAKLFETIIKKGRGCLLVSHRLNQLNGCDRLLVLEAGQIVEDGSPAELLKNTDSQYSNFRRRGE